MSETSTVIQCLVFRDYYCLKAIPVYRRISHQTWRKDQKKRISQTSWRSLPPLQKWRKIEGSGFLEFIVRVYDTNYAACYTLEICKSEWSVEFSLLFSHPRFYSSSSCSKKSSLSNFEASYLLVATIDTYVRREDKIWCLVNICCLSDKRTMIDGSLIGIVINNSLWVILTTKKDHIFLF